MRVFAAILILASLCAGCASGPAVRTDRDPNADLKSYRTFGFFEHASTDRGTYSTLMTSRLRDATAQLERLGYTYDEKAPQLRVNFFVNIVERQELRTTGGAGGFYRYRLGAYGPQGLETVDYKAGTLSIDLVDTQTRALIWQGLAEGRVPRDAYDKPGRAIDRLVSEIFHGFPQPNVFRLSAQPQGK